jgi:hypothetical protein
VGPLVAAGAVAFFGGRAANNINDAKASYDILPWEVEMLKTNKTRRNFLQQTGVWAAGAAGAAAAGSMGMPNFAQAARDKELNIYCWEGYNSDDVLDPFRREFKANVKAEGDQGLGPDQSEQSMGPRNDVAGRVDQGVAARPFRADVLEDDVGIPSALSMGDGQDRRASVGHDPAFRPVQLRG